MNAVSIEQIIEGALALPDEARALLADRLIESLDLPDPELDALWQAEARRRLDEVRAGRIPAIPGEEALAQVRRAVAR